ncbi:MAG: aa3-type cytochrome oxidase subunit CtaJ [Micromonosporaceae bacterium]
MSILETVTVFVGVPAAVFAVIAAAVYVSSVRPGRRYRPGRPYEFTPVWFLSEPQGTAGADRPALEPAEATTDSGTTRKGGARGSW